MSGYTYNWKQHNNLKVQFPRKRQSFVNGVKKRFFIGLGIIFVVALGVGSYLYIVEGESMPVVGGTYREGVVGSPQIINPLLEQTNDTNRDITKLIYRSLMTYNKQGALVPDLAESVDISENNTQYSFVLDPAVRWSDGTPVTAHDVVFTIQLVQNQAYKSPFINNWRGVSVSAHNNHTVVMDLQSVYGGFLENATLPIVPKHIWESVSPEEFATSDASLTQVGSGKYSIDSITRNEQGLMTSIILKRNKQAQEPTPYINALEFKFYGSEQDMIHAYNNRSIDAMSYLSFQSMERIDQDSTTLYEFSFPRYFAIFFNYARNNDIIKDITIRKALARATNKEQIIRQALGGYGKVAHSLIPPSLSTYSPQRASQQASELLESNGWIQNSNGVRVKDGAPLSLTLTIPDTHELEKVAEILQNQWKHIGVELVIQKVDVAELQRNVIPERNYDIILYGETFGSIVDPYPFWHSSARQHPGLNIASLNHGTVDTLLEQGRLEQDPEKRTNIYNQLQEYFTENAVALFLYEPSYLYPVHADIQGIESHTLIDPAYRFLFIEDWYIQTRRSLTI